MDDIQLTLRDYLRRSNLHVTKKYLQATSKTKRLAQDKLVDAILPTGIFAKDYPHPPGSESAAYAHVRKLFKLGIRDSCRKSGSNSLINSPLESIVLVLSRHGSFQIIGRRRSVRRESFSRK
jgi:hypothetical protein